MTDISILDLHTQRLVRPKIETVLPFFLDDTRLNAALDFIKYLRTNKMSPAWAGIHNAWKAMNKGKPICYIRLGGEWIRETKNVQWVVMPYLNHMHQYENMITDEGLQDIVWDDLHYCRGCAYNCPPLSKTILGKNFDNLCHAQFYNGRFPVSFVNPDEVAYNQIKKLLEIEREARYTER